MLAFFMSDTLSYLLQQRQQGRSLKDKTEINFNTEATATAQLVRSEMSCKDYHAVMKSKCLLAKKMMNIVKEQLKPTHTAPFPMRAAHTLQPRVCCLQNQNRVAVWEQLQQLWCSWTLYRKAQLTSTETKLWQHLTTRGRHRAFSMSPTQAGVNGAMEGKQDTAFI